MDKKDFFKTIRIGDRDYSFYSIKLLEEKKLKEVFFENVFL